MSIETLSPRPEAPVTPLAFAAPPANPPTPDCPDPTIPAAGTSTATLQARRLRVARELEDRISRIEQDLQVQANTLAQTGANIRLTLRELQQRSASLTTELLRTGARVARLGRDHEEEHRKLETRLGDGLREIETALAPLRTAMNQQEQQLSELQQRQDTLSRLHHHLDRIVHRQGQQQDILAADFGQRLRLLDVTLETQQEFANDQQTALLALTLQYEQVSIDLQRLRTCLDDFSARLEDRLQQLRHRQQLMASLLAALALLSLALIAWCQTHPLTIPPQTRQQLAVLTSGLQQQHRHAQAQAGALSRHEAYLADLQTALTQERVQNRRLRQEARRHDRQISEVRSQLAVLQEAAAMEAMPSKRTASTSR